MMQQLKSIRPARVLLDGIWRECTWIYPVRKLAPSIASGEDSDPRLLPIGGMVGGVRLVNGWRYIVAMADRRFTVVVENVFDGSNNLCDVTSVVAADGQLPSAGLPVHGPLDAPAPPQMSPSALAPACGASSEQTARADSET